jgi:hypothetical protein
MTAPKKAGSASQPGVAVPHSVASLPVKVSTFTRAATRAGVLATFVVVTSSVAPADERVGVFVKGAGAAGGFTDPNSERADSAKDILRHLSADTRKWVRPAASESDGAIVLEVLSRQKEFRTLVLTVRMRVGDYETELRGSTDSGGGAWRNAALKIAKDVDRWAGENRTKLSPQ